MKLTKRQREILEGLRLAETDLSCEFDLVESDGEVWFGLERTNQKLLIFLLRNCLVSLQDDSGGGSKYYKINSWGCIALDDPNFDPQQKLVECIAAAEKINGH